jgi:glycosyltransferase involved in cell wall biosynthesis
VNATRIQTLQFLDSFHLGGAERQFLNLFEGLRDSEFEVRVGCFRARGEFEGAIDRTQVAEFPIPSLRSARAAGQLGAFVRHLRRHRIDIVHTTTLYPNIFGVVGAWLARTPVIVASVRDMGQIWTPGLLRAQRLACRLADAVVTNAEAIAARLRAEGYAPGKITVIRNGVRPSAVARRSHPGFRRELGVPPGAPLVGAVCRLHPVKRLEDFVDAAALLLRRFPDARFVVVGPVAGSASRENYTSMLRERAAALGIGERVILTGTRDDVAELLSELDVSVLSSASEGLSNTLLESMAAGVPVVATAVGGNPEVVVDGVTGLLTPAGEPAALAAAVASLLEAPERAGEFGQAGQRRVAEHFGCERMVAQTTHLYRRLLARAAARRHRGWERVPRPRSVEG